MGWHVYIADGQSHNNIILCHAFLVAIVSYSLVKPTCIVDNLVLKINFAALCKSNYCIQVKNSDSSSNFSVF